MKARPDEASPPGSIKPKGAIFIVSLLGVLTILIWGSVFALTFIRG